MSEHMVFVYGSLKSGFHNHHLIDDAEFICKTRTREPSWLLEQFNSKSKPGAFVPGVVPGNSYVSGEIYKVNDAGLEKLDKLEENGTRYQRKKVFCGNGAIAWMYIHADKQEAPALTHQQVHLDKSSRTYEWNPPKNF